MIRYPFAACFVLLLTIALSPARADDPPAGRSPIVGYRQLTWDDYPVNDTASGLSAQTMTFLRYALHAQVEGMRSSYTARAESLEFTGGVDRAHSWRRSNVPRDAWQLLQHEQGHFALNELTRRGLEQTPLATLPVGQGKTPRAAYDNLVSRLRQWYQKHLDALAAAQVRYDKETGFGTRDREQDAWSSRFEAALKPN